MQVRAECFRKAGSTPSDAPIQTFMICTYCREKYLLDIKDKGPKTVVPSRKEINKNLCLSMALFYFLSGRKLKLPFWKQKGYKSLSCRSVNKQFTGDVLLKKVALKISQNSNTGNRDTF